MSRRNRRFVRKAINDLSQWKISGGEYHRIKYSERRE